MDWEYWSIEPLLNDPYHIWQEAVGHACKLTSLWSKCMSHVLLICLIKGCNQSVAVWKLIWRPKRSHGPLISACATTTSSGTMNIRLKLCWSYSMIDLGIGYKRAHPKPRHAILKVNCIIIILGFPNYLSKQGTCKNIQTEHAFLFAILRLGNIWTAFLPCT